MEIVLHFDIFESIFELEMYYDIMSYY